MTTPKPNPANRAARRNGATGTSPTPIPTAPPRFTDSTIPIFSAPDQPVTFGAGAHGKTFHLALLTAYGTREAQVFLRDHYPPRLLAGELASVGAQLVEGAGTRQDFGPLFQFMQYVIAESDLNEGADDPTKRGRFTVRDLWIAQPGQLVEALNRFFEYDGMVWLETLVKNSAAAVQGEINEAVRRAAPVIAEQMIQEMMRENTTTDQDSTPRDADQPNTAPQSPALTGMESGSA